METIFKKKKTFIDKIDPTSSHYKTVISKENTNNRRGSLVLVTETVAIN